MTFFRCPACNLCMKVGSFHSLKFCVLCGIPLEHQNEKESYNDIKNKKK